MEHPIIESAAEIRRISGQAAQDLEKASLIRSSDLIGVTEERWGVREFLTRQRATVIRLTSGGVFETGLGRVSRFGKTNLELSARSRLDANEWQVVRSAPALTRQLFGLADQRWAIEAADNKRDRVPVLLTRDDVLDQVTALSKDSLKNIEGDLPQLYGWEDPDPEEEATYRAKRNFTLDLAQRREDLISKVGKYRRYQDIDGIKQLFDQLINDEISQKGELPLWRSLLPGNHKLGRYSELAVAVSSRMPNERYIWILNPAGERMSLEEFDVINKRIMNGVLSRPEIMIEDSSRLVNNILDTALVFSMPSLPQF